MKSIVKKCEMLIYDKSQKAPILSTDHRLSAFHSLVIAGGFYGNHALHEGATEFVDATQEIADTFDGVRNQVRANSEMSWGLIPNAP